MSFIGKIWKHGEFYRENTQHGWVSIGKILLKKRWVFIVINSDGDSWGW